MELLKVPSQRSRLKPNIRSGSTRRSLKLLRALSKLLLSVRIYWLSYLVRLHLLLRPLSPKRKKLLLKLLKQQLLLKRLLLLKKQPLKSNLPKKRKKKISLNFFLKDETRGFARYR